MLPRAKGEIAELVRLIGIDQESIQKWLNEFSIKIENFKPLSIEEQTSSGLRRFTIKNDWNGDLKYPDLMANLRKFIVIENLRKADGEVEKAANLSALRVDVFKERAIAAGIPITNEHIAVPPSVDDSNLPFHFEGPLRAPDYERALQKFVTSRGLSLFGTLKAAAPQIGLPIRKVKLMAARFRISFPDMDTPYEDSASTKSLYERRQSELKERLIDLAYTASKGHRKNAAEVLGLSSQALREWAAELEIDADDYIGTPDAVAQATLVPKMNESLTSLRKELIIEGLKKGGGFFAGAGRYLGIATKTASSWSHEFGLTASQYLPPEQTPSIRNLATHPVPWTTPWTRDLQYRERQILLRKYILTEALRDANGAFGKAALLSNLDDSTFYKWQKDYGIFCDDFKDPSKMPAKVSVKMLPFKIDAPYDYWAYEEVLRRFLAVKALQATNGNVVKAARLIGTRAGNLRTWVSELSIPTKGTGFSEKHPSIPNSEITWVVQPRSLMSNQLLAFRKKILEQALTATQGALKKAADLLDINFRTFQIYLTDTKLNPNDFKNTSDEVAQQTKVSKYNAAAEEFNKEMAIEALKASGGKPKSAAHYLGISESRMWRWMQAYHLVRSDFETEQGDPPFTQFRIGPYSDSGSVYKREERKFKETVVKKALAATQGDVPAAAKLLNLPFEILTYWAKNLDINLLPFKQIPIESAKKQIVAPYEVSYWIFVRDLLAKNLRENNGDPKKVADHLGISQSSLAQLTADLKILPEGSEIDVKKQPELQSRANRLF